MRVIETKVYQYQELSSEAQERAREWYREGDEFFDEFVIEHATTIAGHMGITITDIFWTGFWSQGDGACFEGTFDPEDFNESALAQHIGPRNGEHNGDLWNIAMTIEALAHNHPNASWLVKQTGHYSHENSTQFDFEYDTPGEAEAEYVEAAREFMRWIYRTLETEYEYQSADEQVVESITINEYEFTENGGRF